MFRIERDLPGLPQFNLPFACRLQGPLERASARAKSGGGRPPAQFAAHGICISERAPVAVVATASDIELHPCLKISQLGSLSETGAPRHFCSRRPNCNCNEEAWTPFDITRAPLFRARLLRFGPDDHILLLILHHIIFDGWSIGIFFEEISEVYSSLVAGQQTQLPEQAPQFSQFANWQRWWCSTDLAIRQIAYWKDYVREALPIFPMDGNPASALLGSGMAHEPVHLPKDLVERLRALSRSQGGTLFMTLLAGFKAMLLARTGRGDICVCHCNG